MFMVNVGKYTIHGWYGTVGGCFKYVFYFYPRNLGEMIQFDYFFSNGWLNHQLPGSSKVTSFGPIGDLFGA